MSMSEQVRSDYECKQRTICGSTLLRALGQLAMMRSNYAEHYRFSVLFHVMIPRQSSHSHVIR